MDFYYCPILGLQITFGVKAFEIDLDTKFSGEFGYYIDVESIPEINISAKELIKMMHKQEIMFIDSAENKTTLKSTPRITSNVLINGKTK